MPPRYSYWTIIAGGLPTAFRAAQRDELIPTFARIREKHPDAQMKWFARGKLWESPDAARRELGARREHDGRRSPPPGERESARGQGGRPRQDKRAARRPDEWRPGGEHRDPRQKYKDAKKARNLQHRRDKFSRKQRDGGPRGDARVSDRPDAFGPRGDSARGNAHGRDRRGEHKGGWGDRPAPGGRPPAWRRDRERPRGEARPGPDRGARDHGGSGGSRAGKPGASPHTGGDRWRPSGRDRGSKRPFERRGFERNQGTEEPPAPPRPRGPNREPRPSESPAPTPPPRPTEPVVPPPGPPERGRVRAGKPRQRKP